jgi:hypothetical protein
MARRLRLEFSRPATTQRCGVHQIEMTLDVAREGFLGSFFGTAAEKFGLIQHYVHHSNAAGQKAFNLPVLQSS